MNVRPFRLCVFSYLYADYSLFSAAGHSNVHVLILFKSEVSASRSALVTISLILKQFLAHTHSTPHTLAYTLPPPSQV